MVELRVDFLFLVLLASNRQLQLAQSLAPEEQVDQDVVVLGVHPVLDLDNLETLGPVPLFCRGFPRC